MSRILPVANNLNEKYANTAGVVGLINSTGGQDELWYKADIRASEIKKEIMDNTAASAIYNTEYTLSKKAAEITTLLNEAYNKLQSDEEKRDFFTALRQEINL